MLRRLAGPACVLALFLTASALLPTVTADDKAKANDEGGWVQLFNGKDLEGWRLPENPNPGAFSEIIKQEKDGKVTAYEGKLKKDGTVVPLWRVEDGILIGSGPSSHLFTVKDDYDNFVYRVEAMINDHGNSGQYFRAQFGPGFPNGYEAQINSTHGDPIRSGSLYPSPFLNPPAAEKEKIIVREQLVKPDEWHTQEVTADGNHIIIKVNGKTTVDWVDPNSRSLKGCFALQGHDPGTVVKFRKVEYKPLEKK
jgi:hypothetical protein